MAYATADEVLAVLATTAASSMTTERAEAAIVDAEAEMDARLSERYQTPITASPVPALLKRISIDYSVYRLMLEYRGTADLEERDPAQLRLNESKKLLEDIVNGLANLPIADGVNPADGGTGDPNNVLEDVAFGIDEFNLGYHYRYGDRGPYELGIEWWQHGR